MITAPNAVSDVDDDETPPTPEQLLAELGRKYMRAMAEPTPANPATAGWQWQAAALAALAGRALHALNEQDPTAASRLSAWFHGPLGDGPNPAAHEQWLERFVASPETSQRWADEGRQAAAEAALHAMSQPQVIAEAQHAHNTAPGPAREGSARTACDIPPCEEDPCARHEREFAHTEGEHEPCGSDCAQSEAGGAQ